MTPPEPTGVIHHASSESMRHLEDDSVMLTVTSPPYANAIQYNSFQAKQRSRPTRGYAGETDSYQAYLAQMSRIFAEVFRVTAPGGHLCLNAGNIQDSGRCRPVPYDLMHRLQQLGWEVVQTIVWHKGMRPSLDRAGVLIQHPYPGYWYSNCLHELVLVCRKPGPKVYAGRSEESRQRSRLPLSDLLLREVVNDVWAIPTTNNERLAHPCPFPAELAYRLIALYSYRDDLVLDPFCGSGMTGRVALHLGRRFVGYEIEAQFVELSRELLHTPPVLRPDQKRVRFVNIRDDPFMQLGDAATKDP